jgi:hypothetical protein
MKALFNNGSKAHYGLPAIYFCEDRGRVMKNIGHCSACLAIAAVLVALAIAVPQPVSGDSNPQEVPGMPFAPGERLVFELRWAVIPAGKAVLEVMPMKTIDGSLAYHFRMTAKSNAFVDLFFKVRDRIDSYVAVDMSHSIHYRHKQREGEAAKNIKVHFDWETSTARYFDGKKTRNPIEIAPGTFDPLSVFYYSRLADFGTNGIIRCPVSDGKKCITGAARIIRKETVEVPGGTFETFLMEPELKEIGGVFKKSKNAKIQLWVTADERRLPVKIASKVSVGSFIGELMTIENGPS